MLRVFQWQCTVVVKWEARWQPCCVPSNPPVKQKLPIIQAQLLPITRALWLLDYATFFHTTFFEINRLKNWQLPHLDWTTNLWILKCSRCTKLKHRLQQGNYNTLVKSTVLAKATAQQVLYGMEDFALHLCRHAYAWNEVHSNHLYCP